MPTHFLDVGFPALGSAVTEEEIIGMWTMKSSTLYGSNDITEVSLLWCVIVRPCRGKAYGGQGEFRVKQKGVCRWMEIVPVTE